MTKAITRAELIAMKEQKQPITMLTAYDYPTALLVDQAGIDMILVGDSMGNVVLGYDNTIPVTIDDIVHHTQAVSRGAKRAFVVADMPFLSSHISPIETMRNAGRLIQAGGAKAVKIEGGGELAATVKALTDAGIPVMGHLGLTPQSVHQMGGYKVQGKTATAGSKMLADAKALQEAGAFAIVLECVPTALAEKITAELTIPTIGIGAGNVCDGQVLVIHDLLGVTDGFIPKFVKQYANIHDIVIKALQTYRNEVQERSFPDENYSFAMPDEELKKLS